MWYVDNGSISGNAEELKKRLEERQDKGVCVGE